MKSVWKVNSNEGKRTMIGCVFRNIYDERWPMGRHGFKACRPRLRKKRFGNGDAIRFSYIDKFIAGVVISQDAVGFRQFKVNIRQ